MVDQERSWGGELEGVKKFPVMEGPKLEGGEEVENYFV